MACLKCGSLPMSLPCYRFEEVDKEQAGLMRRGQPTFVPEPPYLFFRDSNVIARYAGTVHEIADLGRGGVWACLELKPS